MNKDFRADFPFFQDTDNASVTYFDSAATTQKPHQVIQAVQQSLALDNFNVHRSSYQQAQQATDRFEAVRTKVQTFINAAHGQEIVWTKGCTDSINLVADILGQGYFKAGDVILLSQLEHHANIVPWQRLAQRLQLHIKVIPADAGGCLLESEALTLIEQGVALLAIGHVSNALGNINPVERLITAAKQQGALTLVDGAQAIPHLPVDVQQLGCDFYCFSGHKMFAPAGIGVLYGKLEWLQKLPPYQSGGEMIRSVSFTEGTRFQEPPFKFEPGTPNVAGVMGLSAAIDYLQAAKNAGFYARETALYQLLLTQLALIPEVRLLGGKQHSIAIQSFIVNGLDSFDLGQALTESGYALRVGHHCAMPLMQHLGVSGTLRVSLSGYNTESEILAFASTLKTQINTLLSNQQDAELGSANPPEQVQTEQKSNGPQSAFGPIAEKLLAAKGWEQKQRQIMLAGKQLPLLPTEQRTADNLVSGCESEVYLAVSIEHQKLQVLAFSPSKIIRGLLALLFEAVLSQDQTQLQSFDLDQYFQLLQLHRFLSHSRGNGMREVLAVIRGKVAELT